MRLGGPVFVPATDLDAHVAAARAAGYRAIYCPLAPTADDDQVHDLLAACARHDVLIAETGAWSNPLSTDEPTRLAALAKCQAQLALADRVGARCCVNIAGSRGEKWDGPDRRDLTKETFALIVESVRTIIDAVKPSRACYTLETMPWMYPDSPKSYLRLLQAVDRKQFAVHFDPVNLINCPARYFDTAAVIKEFVSLLGPRIRSCHFKDITLQPHLTTHLDECRPGTGGLDYPFLLRTLSQLDPDLPVMLEHLPNAEEYTHAAAFVQRAAAAAGVTV